LESIESINRSLFLIVNGGAETPSWLVTLALSVGDGLIYAVPAILLCMWLWGDHARRSLALKAFAVAMLAVGANQVIGMLWQHPRPFAMGLGRAWIEHAADSSFPSDHVTVLASLGLTFTFGGASVMAALVLISALAVAWARVFLGVHFPMDMVGALVVAGFVLLIVTPLWQRAGTFLTDRVALIYRKALAWPIAAGWIRS